MTKEEKSDYNKIYYKANKDNIKEYYKTNKDKIREYYETNKEKKKEKSKEYYKANKEKKREYQKANKDKIKEYEKQKRKENPLYKMKCNLRSRTSKAFRTKGYSKNTKTQEMLGVDWEVCKAHIEKQFTKGMNWDNYGEWHIDHTIPLASANNEKELMKLCHYRNLQPLWAEDNLMKSGNIPNTQTYFKL
jgi:superfamily II DNA/RNA helicase